jgi:serine protease AprX
MKSLFILLIVASSFAFSQTKYLIYFKDKGVYTDVKLNKSDVLYKEALDMLSPRAVERRKKNLGDDIISYEDIPIKNDYIISLEGMGIEIVHKLTWFNAVSAYLNDIQPEEIISLSFIDKVEEVKSFRVKHNENLQENIYKNSSAADLNYGQSFGQLNLSDIPVVHSQGITGQGVLIGLLDTGYDWKNHESLVNADVVAEWDFIFNDSVTANQSGDHPSQHDHGTSVMSVVGGYKDSVLIGSSFGSSFILAKTEDIRSETQVEEDNYAAALLWMENHGVDITSSSLGYSEFDDFSYTYEDMNGQTTIVTRACEMTFRRGVVTITSAGNEGMSSWRYITAPADGFNTIAVGAVDNNNIVTGFSSRGPTYDGRIKPDILTQGASVFGAVTSGFSAYRFFGGTSAAAPIASGAAGLLLSAHPHLKNVQVRSILLETADNSASPNNDRGYGLISAAGAINFPNLQEENSRYKLHKLFINNLAVNPSTVEINYTIDEEDPVTADMLFDGSSRYNFTFPVLVNNQIVDFYFTYSDTSGANYREPATGSYKFAYGQLVISLNLEVSIAPADFILSQNYPNPFNNGTIIDFISSFPEPAELFIYDVLGQKIKILFKDITKAGVNSVVWDGTMDSGESAASGPYFYVLRMSGNQYVKKMILLR